MQKYFKSKQRTIDIITSGMNKAYLLVLVAVMYQGQGQRQGLPQRIGNVSDNVGALWLYRFPDIAEEEVSRSVYPVTTNWDPLELVDGVESNSALRLDGYSTWVDGKHTMASELQEFTLSVWVALSSYPGEVGALFAREDMVVQLNCYGQITLIFKTIYNEKVIVDVTGVVIPLFKWAHIAIAVVPNEIVIMYLDGEQVFLEAMNSYGFVWPQEGQFYIGRNPVADDYFGFDRNVLNGIIDEVVLYSEFMAPQEIKMISVKNGSRDEVNLHVPKERFAKDFNRPRYHLMPEAAWTNEPNGFIHYNGTYHLFNQKNGNGPYWWRLNLGHFTSPDLITWTEHQPALWPTQGPDHVGVWSGHTILSDEGVPTTLYTGVNGVYAGVFVATSNIDGMDEKLLHWEKSDKNPVIPRRPNLFLGDDFRDPFVWKDDQNIWNMIIGSGIDTKQGRVGGLFLYKSTDLVQWEFVDKPFFVGDPSTMGGPSVGSFWEMPVLVFMNGKVILAVNRTPCSAGRADVLYWVGDITQDQFVPDFLVPKTLELLICELAPTVIRDHEDRLVAIGINPDTWIAFKQDWVEHKKLGWANIMSLPKVWTLDEKRGKILRAPYPELQKLRTSHINMQNEYLNANQDTYLNDSFSGLQLEIIATFQPSRQTEQVGLTLLKSPNGEEQTTIYYDYISQQIVCDRSKSSLNNNAVNDITASNYALSREDNLTLHVFVDHSAIEVFINYEDAFSTRVFTTMNQSSLLDIFVVGDGTHLGHLDVWKLRSQDEQKIIDQGETINLTSNMHLSDDKSREMYATFNKQYEYKQYDDDESSVHAYNYMHNIQHITSQFVEM